MVYEEEGKVHQTEDLSSLETKMVAVIKDDERVKKRKKKKAKKKAKKKKKKSTGYPSMAAARKILEAMNTTESHPVSSSSASCQEEESSALQSKPLSQEYQQLPATQVDCEVSGEKLHPVASPTPLLPPSPPSLSPDSETKPQQQQHQRPRTDEMKPQHAPSTDETEKPPTTTSATTQRQAQQPQKMHSTAARNSSSIPNPDSETKPQQQQQQHQHPRTNEIKQQHVPSTSETETPPTSIAVVRQQQQQQKKPTATSATIPPQQHPKKPQTTSTTVLRAQEEPQKKPPTAAQQPLFAVLPKTPPLTKRVPLVVPNVQVTSNRVGILNLWSSASPIGSTVNNILYTREQGTGGRVGNEITHIFDINVSLGEKKKKDPLSEQPKRTHSPFGISYCLEHLANHRR